MAAGLPLVSTAQGVSGLAVQPQVHYLAGENAEALADAVVRLLDEPALAGRLADAARDYARQYHDWAVAGNELEHLYRSLLTAKESQPCA